MGGRVITITSEDVDVDVDVDVNCVFSTVDQVDMFRLHSTNIRLVPLRLNSDQWLILRVAMDNYSITLDNNNTVHDIVDMSEAIELDKASGEDL